MSDKCQCAPNCRFTADPGSPFNIRHDKRPEMQERRRAVMSATGKAGGDATTAARGHVKLVLPPSLRNSDDLLGLLEKAAFTVVNGGGTADKKALAICKIVDSARAVLKSAELETENKELRKLLLDRHPELKKHLKSV